MLANRWFSSAARRKSLVSQQAILGSCAEPGGRYPLRGVRGDDHRPLSQPGECESVYERPVASPVVKGARFLVFHDQIGRN